MTSLRDFIEEKRHLVIGGRLHEYAKHDGLYRGHISDFKLDHDNGQVVFEVTKVEKQHRKGFLPVWESANSHPFVYQAALLVSDGDRFRFELGQWLKIRNYGLYGFVMITPVGHPHLL